MKDFVPGPFRGHPFYDEEGDALEWFFENRESWSEWIDNQLTVHRAFDNDEVVGCRISGFKKLILDLISQKLGKGD